MEPQNPTIPAPPPPKKNNLVVILLSIFLLITLLISGYLFLQVQSLTKQLAQSQVQIQPTPIPSPAEASTQEGTANWKTYRDNFFNFEIKYPSDWEYSNKDESTFAGLIFLRPILKEPLSAFPPEYGLITINISKGNLKDIESYINSQCPTEAKCSEIKDVVLGGLPAKSFKSSLFYPEKFVVLRKSINDPAFKEIALAFKLRLDKAFNETYSEDQKNSVFDQILSTFKFTD